MPGARDVPLGVRFTGSVCLRVLHFTRNNSFRLLVKRQDVFGGVGGPDSLVDRIVGPEEAPEMYAQFEQNKIWKVVFDMWK